jgi:hypothetical protein
MVVKWESLMALDGDRMVVMGDRIKVSVTNWDELLVILVVCLIEC